MLCLSPVDEGHPKANCVLRNHKRDWDIVVSQKQTKQRKTQEDSLKEPILN